MQLENTQLIISISIILLVLLVLGFSLFFFFYKKKTDSLLAKMRSDMVFQSELTQSSLEIKEEILGSFSRELHDNIGQLLSVAVMHLNIQIEDPEKVEKENLIIVKKTVEKSLNEIRTISKLINGEIHDDHNFTELLSDDLKRIELLKNISCNLNITGTPNVIVEKHQIIIYRMLQESISNILKHSQSSQIDVNINNNDDCCKISIKDYGTGFLLEDKNRKGFGLNNIRARARLINADYYIRSIMDKGTTVFINYYYSQAK